MSAGEAKACACGCSYFHKAILDPILKVGDGATKQLDMIQITCELSVRERPRATTRAALTSRPKPRAWATSPGHPLAACGCADPLRLAAEYRKRPT